MNLDFDLKKYLESKREIVEEKLLSYMGEETLLKEAMKYSLMAGGKRLRPVLCIAGCEVTGGSIDECLDTACAIEMIHTYSLIHDDLPEMDNDDLRRGKETCHVRFDHGTALLAGDGLLTLAFEILSDPSNVTAEKAVKRLKIASMVAKAAGFNGMIEGQMLDVDGEGKNLSFEELENIHRLKTGEMIKVSVLTGAVSGKASESDIEKLSIYSEKVGLAFQVTDDILNVEGDPIIMGKAVGTDEKLNKATYPSIMGLEKSKEFAGELIKEALLSIRHFDDKASPLRAVAEYILNRKR